MSRQAEAPLVVDGPTLLVGIAWVEAHVVVPDGDLRGSAWQVRGWQLQHLANHYQVRPDATVGQMGTAFRYRRSLVVGPQKLGKSPHEAAHSLLEGVGPALFDGWAGRDDGYACADHGCRCGWEFPYQAGEPMGRPWATPLIQITATSEDQAENVFGVLRPMIELGPLGDLVPRVGEEFIRLPGQGRIDLVTANATSRLGQRVTFVVQDETGIWTKQNGMAKVATTQRRGLAGMGGRSVEITNPWDPAEQSVAQQTWESTVSDVYKQWRQAPADLSYRDKRERRRIHRHVYEGAPWVDLDAIEAEAAELLERDPGEAERFFGNRVVAGLGAFLPQGLWEQTGVDYAPKPGALITLGFDGSDSDDWTALRAVDLATMTRFTPTYGPDARPTWWNPAEWGGQIPRAEVDAAVDELHERFDVRRAYGDPPGWRSEIGEWSQRHGDKVWLEWMTNRPAQMHAALVRSVTDLASGRSNHDLCPMTAVHYSNARKLARPSQRFIIGKASQQQKIDLAMADTLAYEAACDALAAGLTRQRSRVVHSF